MRFAALAVLLILTGCASAPRPFPPFPQSGIQVIRADQSDVFRICGGHDGYSDGGAKIAWDWDILGCWLAAIKTIYIEDSCRGAQALVHEWGHAEGVRDPKKAGYNWDDGDKKWE